MGTPKTFRETLNDSKFMKIVSKEKKEVNDFKTVIVIFYGIYHSPFKMFFTVLNLT